MKLKGERTYYFAVPLLEIHLKKHDIHFSKKYGFCSFYFPSKYQDTGDFLYLVKAYEYFDNDCPNDIHFFNDKDLIFGESLYIPFIPTRGDMKWLLMGEKDGERKYNDFPDLRISSLPTTIHPQKRNWFLLKNAGMNEESWHIHKRTYAEVKHLELGEVMSEVTVKLRMYISILKMEFLKRRITVDIEEWKQILFDIIVNEPATKKTKPEEIKNDFLEGFISDYVNSWE